MLGLTGKAGTHTPPSRESFRIRVGVGAAGAAMVVGVWWVDQATGGELAFSIFYVLPVTLVTFSFGAGTFEDAPTSGREAIQVVDELMYRVKAAGKNGVAHEVIGPALPPGPLES
jgi:hypothetical protein